MNIQEYKQKRIKEIDIFLQGLHFENIGVKDKKIISYVTPECSDFFNKNKIFRSVTENLLLTIQGYYNLLIFTELEFLSADERIAKQEIDTAIRSFIEKVRTIINSYKNNIIKISFRSEKISEEDIVVEKLPEVKEKNLLYTGLNFIKIRIGEESYSVPKTGREAENEDVEITGLYQIIIYIYALKLMIEDKKEKIEEFKNFVTTNFSITDGEYLSARQFQNIFLNEQVYEQFVKKYNIAVEELVSQVINENVDNDLSGKKSVKK